jgi:hypothetical protein
MNFARHGITDPDENHVKESVKATMANEKRIRNIYDRIYDQKLMHLFKKTFTIETKEVSYDEFLRMKEHEY